MARLQTHRNKSGNFGKQLGNRKPAFFGNNLPSTTTPPQAVFSDGFRNYGLNILGIRQGPVREFNGPGEPPEGFVGGTTSISEWYIYWALEKILGPEGNDWSYQQSVLGGRHGPGGAVIDFVVYWREIAYALRIQTYRFHIAAGPEKQGYDREQIYSISSGTIIVLDIYEEDYIDDPTGQATIKVVMEALNGEYMLSPIASGRGFGRG